MSLTLVIMAAGAGSRFGGNKPLASVGPDGQSLFEYSVNDAFKAGFCHVIFVVNAQQDTQVFSDRLQVYGDALTVEFVVQSLDTEIRTGAEQHCFHSVNRLKPWGTAHAVLACKHYINNPFVVINADDYYGQDHYEKIGQYLLAQSAQSHHCAMPGYSLQNTLSASGGVNRGICEVSANGHLESIREVHNISVDHAKVLQYDQADKNVAVHAGSIVSMTFWGFMPSIFDLLQTDFQRFLADTSNLDQDEFLLPEVINKGIVSEQLQVRVFDTNEKWKGLTFRHDLPGVKTYLAELTDAGRYSTMLNGVGDGAVND